MFGGGIVQAALISFIPISLTAPLLLFLVFFAILTLTDPEHDHTKQTETHTHTYTHIFVLSLFEKHTSTGAHKHLDLKHFLCHELKHLWAQALPVWLLKALISGSCW